MAKQIYFKTLIENWGLECIEEYKIGLYICDLFVPKLNLIIEIDGLSHYVFYDKMTENWNTVLRNQMIENCGYSLMVYSYKNVTNKRSEKEFIQNLYAKCRDYLNH